MLKFWKNRLTFLIEIAILLRYRITIDRGRLDLINRRNVEQIFVIESKAESKIIGTITVFIEMKFIHGINQVGHIEDFVVDKNFRGLKLGKKLMNVAKNFCLENNCYKIILDCEDSLIPLYERFGFKKKANSMQLYYI